MFICVIIFKILFFLKMTTTLLGRKIRFITGWESNDLPCLRINQTQSSSQTKQIHTKKQEPSEKSGGSFLLSRCKDNRKLELQTACVLHYNVNPLHQHRNWYRGIFSSKYLTISECAASLLTEVSKEALVVKK